MLFQTWETRYILLLWLSIVVMIPFELSRFDGGLPGAGGGAPQGRVADRIMEVAKVRKGVQVFCTTGLLWASLCRQLLCVWL